jgi:hypothetical protein
VADHDKGAFDRITGADALPILGGEVEECHEVFAVFLQAQRHFGIFGLIGFGEQVRGLFRIIFGLGLPNVVDRVMSLCLKQLGQAIEDVDCLVLPTPLLSGRGIDFIHGDPHPYGTVSNRQSGAFSPRIVRRSRTSRQLWVDLPTPSSMARTRLLLRAVSPTITWAQSLSSLPRSPLWTPSAQI